MDIFVVDDEPVIVETAVAILQFHGYDAVGFDDPSDALVALSGGCPKVLLADFIMKDVNGVQLATRAVEACPDCRVIFMTASLNTDPLEASGLASFILAKPVGVDELMTAVQEVLPTPRP